MTKHKARQAEQKVIRVCCLWPYTNVSEAFGYTRCFLASATHLFNSSYTTFNFLLHRLLSTFIITLHSPVMMVPTVVNVSLTDDLARHLVSLPITSEKPYSETTADSPFKNPSNSRFVTAAQKDTKASDGGGFTDVQDRQLIKLKIEEKKPWKEIATELGKDIGEVKERWQKVRPDKQGDDKPEGEAKKDDKQEANKKEKRKDSAIALGFAELAAIEVEPDEHFGLNEVCLHPQYFHIYCTCADSSYS